MKSLLILITLLLSFNSFAQFRVTIVKTNEATMGFEAKTLKKATKRLKKIILSKRRFKGEYTLEEEGSIFKRALRVQPETTIVEDALEFVGIEPEIKLFEYYHSLNFTVKVEDITKAMKEKEDAEVAGKKERTKFRKMDFNKKSSESVSEWRARIAKAMNRMAKLLRK